MIVERLIDSLKHCDNSSQYVILGYVEDELISPKRKKYISKIWTRRKTSSEKEEVSEKLIDDFNL